MSSLALNEFTSLIIFVLQNTRLYTIYDDRLVFVPADEGESICDDDEMLQNKQNINETMENKYKNKNKLHEKLTDCLAKI